MKEVEKIFNRQRLEIEQLEVPEELETRLRNVLVKRGQQRKGKGFRVKLIAAFIAIFLIGYQFDTLAFYGKKLMGYDQVMDGTLKQLNELGKGQTIGKSYTFKNGITFTLDGIMLDDNQLLAFYTLKDPKGNVDTVDIDPWMFFKGSLGKYSIKSAHGKLDEGKTELKLIAKFATPLFFEKRLSLHFALLERGNREEGEIAFTLERNKAMGHTLKKTLNIAIKVDETKIRLNSILASPTTTVITGAVQNIVELAMDEMKGERIRPHGLQLKLIANGEELSPQSGGMSTDLKGITFHHEYDALPKNLQKLQVRLVSFAADHDVNQQIELQKDMSKSVEVIGQKIKIEKVYESENDTYVTITTEENVVLTKVNLLIDGNTVRLEEALSSEYEKKTDGTILHTRTLHFPGTGKELKLDIQRMTYAKTYNKVVDIPLD